MRVITAVEQYIPKEGDITVFLAGGITNCWEWQDKIIELLMEKGDAKQSNELVIFNPRRKNFPIDDPNASYDQICWEFKMLEKADIFSMYFCGDTPSDQPICMYELGRNIVRMQMKYPAEWQKRIIVSLESKYKRKNDVIIQTELATNDKINVRRSDDPLNVIDMHVADIYTKYINLITKF